MSNTTPSSNDNLGPSLLISCWTLAAVAIIVVVLRLSTRVKIIGKLTWDDHTMTLSLLIGLVSTALYTVAVLWGVGRHLQYLDPISQVQASKYDFVAQPFVVIGPCLSRISFALFLKQIVSKSIKKKRFLDALIACQLFVNFSTAVIILAQCRPIGALWDKAVNGSCWTPLVQRNYSYFQGSWNSLTDLILAFFPITFLWKLHLPTEKKVGLTIIMGLGVFAMIASIIKTIALKSLNEKADFTYKVASLTLWATIELYVVIIAASIPAIVPLYNKCVKKLSTYKCTIRSWSPFSSLKRNSKFGYQSRHSQNLPTRSARRLRGESTQSEEFILSTIASPAPLKVVATRSTTPGATSNTGDSSKTAASTTREWNMLANQQR